MKEKIYQVWSFHKKKWVRSRSRPGLTPGVWSTHHLDLDLQKWVQSTLSLARTLGPMGSVRSGPGSARARTGLRTVYSQSHCVLFSSTQLPPQRRCHDNRGLEMHLHLKPLVCFYIYSTILIYTHLHQFYHNNMIAFCILGLLESKAWSFLYLLTSGKNVLDK